MAKFNNKRRYQWDLIGKWLQRNKNLSKTQLANKMGVSRVTLNKILGEYKSMGGSFKPFSRSYANNRIPDGQRMNVWNETTIFLIELNKNRRETKFIPTFGMLKSFVPSSDNISLRSFANIIKENNFYLPWCTRKTKKDIRKRIKQANKVEPLIQDLMQDIEEIKTTRIYKKKSGIQGDILEIDACPHPWFSDESYHLYRIVDAATGTRLAQHVEKEETSMGYLKMLKMFFKEHGVPRVIIADKRKSFWNGEENGSQISLMLMELDIEVITSSEPTAKPNVERSFHDAQQLYPLLCYTKKVTNLTQFKKMLPNFLKLSNKQYNKKFDFNNSNLMKINDQLIDKAMNLKLRRKVTNGNTLVINGTHWVPTRNNKRQLMQNDQRLTILSNDEFEKYIIYKNTKYPLVPLSEKYEVISINKEWKAIDFEKRKTRSMYKTLEKKRVEIERLLLVLKKQYPNRNIDI